jgi:hypothetical protein
MQKFYAFLAEKGVKDPKKFIDIDPDRYMLYLHEHQTKSDPNEISAFQRSFQ